MQKLTWDHTTSEKRPLRWGWQAGTFRLGFALPAAAWSAYGEGFVKLLRGSRTKPAPAWSSSLAGAPRTSVQHHFQNLWRRCSSLSSWASPGSPHWLAGDRGPCVHPAEPETTVLYFLFDAGCISASGNTSFFTEPFLLAYLLTFPLHTLFIVIALTKAPNPESRAAFGLCETSSAWLWQHLLNSNYWCCCSRELSSWCFFISSQCWGWWTNVSSGADIHSVWSAHYFLNFNT